MIQLGAQLYTVRDFTQNLEDIEKTFQKCQKQGFETVQISGFGPVPFNKLNELIQRYHIQVCCTHSPVDRFFHDLPALIEEHHAMQCPVIGLGAMPASYRESADGIDRFIEDFTPIAETIVNSGLRFAYHNHNFEFQKRGDRTIMDQLIDDTDPRLFHFIPDTYWLHMGGVNPADYLRRLQNRVEVCHFKDLAIDGMTPVFAEVGEGNLDLAACFTACQELGVQAIVIEQDTCPRDPFDCLRNSYQNLQALAIQAGDR